MASNAGNGNAVNSASAKKTVSSRKSKPGSVVKARNKKTQSRKSPRKVLRTAGKSPLIHCMLAMTGQDSVLLPTGVIAEVIDFHDPSPLEGSPPWLLGQIEWNERQVPVFSFSALINGEYVGGFSSNAKIMIIKSLADTARVPYLGILLSDLPRMLNIKDNDLVQTGDDKKSLGVFSRITVNEQDAIVPDLDRLTHLVTHATLGALPITQLDL